MRILSSLSITKVNPKQQQSQLVFICTVYMIYTIQEIHGGFLQNDWEVVTQSTIWESIVQHIRVCECVCVSVVSFPLPFLPSSSPPPPLLDE